MGAVAALEPRLGATSLEGARRACAAHLAPAHRAHEGDAPFAARVATGVAPERGAALDELDALLQRMSGHVRKKTPQLRKLASW